MSEEIKKQYGYTVWKFPLEITDEQEIDIPAHAQLLDAQMQNGQLCLWALCNVNNPSVKRKIFIFGTGHKIDFSEVGSYVSTFQMENGELVFHVFDQKDPVWT
jgi:hypothetical protein